jgi:DNA-directed RNA polymerase specialized sigma24 family protein
MYDPVWEDWEIHARALADKYEWAVAKKGYTFDDLVQEAAIKFVEVRDRYPVETPQHFNALFRSSVTRRFIDLQKSTVRTGDVVRTDPKIEEHWGHPVDRDLEIDLREAGSVVQGFVKNTLAAKSTAPRRRSDGTRESRGQRLKRLGRLRGDASVLRATIENWGNRYLRGDNE